MTETRFLLSRRNLLLSAGAAALTAACASGAGSVATPSGGLEGRVIYTESVQMSGGAPNGSSVFSIRLCQYPEIGVAWVWASVMTPEGNFLFADNEIPWSGQAADAANATDVHYAASAGDMTIRFSRTGKHGAIDGGTLEFEKGGEGGFRVSAKFTRSDGYVGLLDGRSEMFGTVEAVIEAGGETRTISAPGQWHEQPQTEPRFTVPFVYSSLWGKGISGTLLQSPEGSGAYALRPGKAPEIFSKAGFSPPGAERTVELVGEDGTTHTLHLEQRHLYTLEIYGKTWIGTFVHGSYMDQPVVGFINNWLM